MKISIVGTGYVGLCSAVGFGIKGHEVICVDVDKEKVDKINRGVSPIFEEGLDKGLNNLIQMNRIHATTDLAKAVEDSELSLICVGTPSDDKGNIDLKYIKKAAEDIGLALRYKSGIHFIVVKSTVVPGTTETVSNIIEINSGKRAGVDFFMAMNPEFLREGKALSDFLNPNRIVIGADDEKATRKMEDLYREFAVPIVKTNIKTAEMIKYASNGFLATKISYMNEIGNLCKILGIDTNEVARGMSFDERISPHFLEAGIGFGGSCFPKDVAALEKLSENSGYEPELLKSVLAVNKRQPHRIIEVLKKKMNLRNARVAVLGLAFKEDTDDIRESPSIIIIRKLLEEGAQVTAYDPKAAENMMKVLPDIQYASSAKDCLRGADACLLLVKWNEFKELKNEDFSSMRGRIIIEGKRILDRSLNHEGVCW